MNRQESYRAAYRQLQPTWQDSVSLYRDLIDQRVTATTRVLDVGCGHGDLLRDIYARTPDSYGLEPDLLALRKNTIIRHVVNGMADQLPFADGFFDLVVAAWVLEHLAQPRQAFGEICRVLKPGGQVIFLTPNAWNYNVWLIRAVPNVLHGGLVQWLYQRQAEDTYPVRYRINTPRQLERTLMPLGFRRHRLIMNGDPSYISFNEPLFRFACAIERLLDQPRLQAARVHLIGVYEKLALEATGTDAARAAHNHKLGL